MKKILTENCWIVKAGSNYFTSEPDKGCPARLKNAHMTDYDALSVYLSINLLRIS